MTQGLDVDLPETKAAQELPADKDHLILTVDRSGRIFVDEFEVKVEELENYLKKLVVDQKKALYMKADGDVPYGVVVKVMGEAKAAGIDKLGMVAEQTRDALQAPKLPEKK